MTIDKTDKRSRLPKTVGKGMIVAAWIVLLLMLTLYFNAYLRDEHNPNRELLVDRQGELPKVSLRRNKGGHYLAPGEINGEAVDFLVDTGATDVAIPVALADKLKLHRYGISQTVTANGNIRAWRTVLNEVRLGPIIQKRVRGVIMPNMTGDQVLLGMSFLRSLDLLQRDGWLHIAQRDGGG